MKYNYLKAIFFVLSNLISSFGFALDSGAIEKNADAFIQTLYHKHPPKPNTNTAERITWYSARFLGKPYLLGALGEGPRAKYDQFPRYRMDAFDCETYVTTVLALTQSDSLSTFKKNLSAIRYVQGKVGYVSRNHFTSIDWNQNNQKRGLLTDITWSLTDSQKKPVARLATALINKPNWYAHKTLSTIRLQHPDKKEAAKRLAALQNEGKLANATLSRIPYVPFTALFVNNKPNARLFSQIPQGAVIEIIRPNWDLRKTIGTALNVSHLGFAIWINGLLYFREASSELGKVVDVPLIQYLQKAQKSPTIKGINIQVVSKLPLRDNLE